MIAAEQHNQKNLNAVAALLTHFDRVDHSIEDSDSLLISSAIFVGVARSPDRYIIHRRHINDFRLISR